MGGGEVLDADLIEMRGIGESCIDKRNNRAELALRELQEQYLMDDRPWVVAYSGGKDSTLVLQLVVESLKALGSKARKPVYVISSDTRVEAPQVIHYVEQVLDALSVFARRKQLAIRSEIVRPTIEQGFWTKLIGLGYPPPTRWFRWCTSNMKIKPSRAKIDEISRIHGSVILLLGSRRKESGNRSRSMESRERNNRGLNPHHEIPNAYVLTPIADWDDDEVWEFLFESNPPPWGFPHDEMLELYKQANGGECPVVIDLNTPSCGGSRFGCWTCTVVKLDKSMEGFVQSGAAWLQPLNDFRNWLKEIREQQSWRQNTRRSGEPGIGPFNPGARVKIFKRLLEVEKKTGIQLISEEEILYIQKLWSREFDLGESRAIDLANEFGRDIDGGVEMTRIDNHRDLIETIAVKNEVSVDVIEKLISLEADFSNLHKYGARTEFRSRITDIVDVALRQANMTEGHQS